MFAPTVPKLARISTGNGIPYFAPGCPLRIIGTSTMQLPSATVSTACHHDIPSLIMLPASVYVGMHTAIPFQSAAMCHVDHVRCSGRVGARSGLESVLMPGSSAKRGVWEQRQSGTQRCAEDAQGFAEGDGGNEGRATILRFLRKVVGFHPDRTPLTEASVKATAAPVDAGCAAWCTAKGRVESGSTCV